jgi:catechol 2,3-dioxygenase-like lactoylglutathione lyase family enzyme
MQIQTDSCCGLISKGRLSDFKTFRMAKGSRRKRASNTGADVIRIILEILSQCLMQLEGIDHVALAVRDVEQSANWYVDVLGFERRFEEMWDGVPTFIAKGNTAIALFPLRNNDSKPSSRTGRIGMLHLAFRANHKNFRDAQEELKRRGIKFEFQDHEISHSIYFRDPDGHQLEITTYDLGET